MNIFLISFKCYPLRTSKAQTSRNLCIIEVGHCSHSVLRALAFLSVMFDFLDRQSDIFHSCSMRFFTLAHTVCKEFGSIF